MDCLVQFVLISIPVSVCVVHSQSDPPNPDMIPDEDKVGVTVVLVTCSYRGREFVRVGYYVNNDYADPFLLENPPNRVDITKLQRNILADKPRVTRFPIDWTPAGARDQDAMMNDENTGAVGGNGVDLSMDFVDDEELVKAAAQLDHNYTDIVIGGANGQGNQLEEDIDLEDDEEDDEDSVEEAEEEDADGDQEMDLDQDEDIDLDDDL